MMEQLLMDLVARRIINQDEFRGASDSEIAQLEKNFGVQFPEQYKTFLGAMGRGAGRFLRSDHWSFAVESIPEINKGARQLLDAADFQGRWFCFATRMGEVYLFFMADGSSDNPPVYVWDEGIDPRIEKGFESLCDWVKAMIDDYKSWR